MKIATRSLAIASLLLAASATVAPATPVQSLPGLVNIRFLEVTGITTTHTFGVSSSQLTTQLAGALGVGNNDFTGTPTEYYDVFYSDAAGTFDANGAYVSVECTFNQSGGGGGCNIAEILFDFTGDLGHCACGTSSAVYLGGNSIAGTAANASDCNTATFSTMGNTSASGGARMRITVFPPCVVPTRHDTWGRVKTLYR